MRRRSVILFGIAAAIILLAPLPGGAAEPGLSPAEFGPEINLLYIGAAQFTCTYPTNPEGCKYTAGAYGWWYTRNTNGQMVFAQVNLPAGALITGYRFFYRDDDPSGWIKAYLVKNWHTSDDRGHVFLGQIVSGEAETPGYTEGLVDVDPDETVMVRRWFLSKYWYYNYVMVVTMSDDGNSLGFPGVLVYWKRQVSPAPVSPSFGDVPREHWAYPFIEALADAGITAGCSDDPPLYCPDDPITRAEMAVYLAAALGLHWPN